jgi:hypothetical protein
MSHDLRECLLAAARLLEEAADRISNLELELSAMPQQYGKSVEAYNEEIDTYNKQVDKYNKKIDEEN